MSVTEGTFETHGAGWRLRAQVSADGRGVVGHADHRLLTDIADATGLTSGFSEALTVAGRRAAALAAAFIRLVLLPQPVG